MTFQRARFCVGDFAFYPSPPIRQRPTTVPQSTTIVCAHAMTETAGTTWLEELIGLAEAGGEGLARAKEIYASAMEHIDELTGPFAAVIAIDRSKLSGAQKVASWTSEQFTGALRHDQRSPSFNPSLRQLLHVSFKLAAKQGNRYLDLLKENEEVVGRNVTENPLRPTSAAAFHWRMSQSFVSTPRQTAWHRSFLQSPERASVPLATTMALIRFSTCSFLKMLSRCFSTVRLLTPRMTASSELLFPSAIQ